MSTLFHDDEHGGWFDEVDTDGQTDDTDKRCYGHAHVLLAAATAVAAEVDGARELLDEATEVHDHHFWEHESGRCVESFSRGWSQVDPYRGANSNMHTVEAYLVACDVTRDPIWHDRALAIRERIIGIHARSHAWRIPEHYDHDWTPVPEYNVESPADPFRPYGATPGHAFEWSRLLLQLAASLDEPRPWILEAAEARQAVEDTAEDDTPGLAYTTDWHGEPVVRERFHWVIAEAVLAAEALHTYTGTASLRRAGEPVVVRDRGALRRRRHGIVAPRAGSVDGTLDAHLARQARRLPRVQRPDAARLPPLAPSAALTIGGVAA